MTDESKNKENKEGDGIGVDGAAGESEKEGGREKEGGEGEESLAVGFCSPKDEEIKGGQGRGKEEITHKLWLNSKTGGVREAERAVGAAGAEEGFGAGQAASVEDALDEAENANDSGRDEEGEKEAGFGVFGGFEERQEEKDSKNGKEEEPDDAGGEEAAEGIF